MDLRELSILEELELDCLSSEDAWHRDGLTRILRDLRNRCLVDCRDHAGQRADPLDISGGARWVLTEEGQALLNVIRLRDQPRLAQNLPGPHPDC